ncbi:MULTISPECIES: polysaccharide deacetylase family protein [unclassified Streptomyces]|uniref:polysaccharide deacetylase family protein n=1 Tax=unclassified Streptomyces TaxID=2593676 RepID=UPI00093E16C9|nr:polysaccharide deacetylase family protein [Streptomyces sp. TSRI0107]OKJ84057.1 hypothetical protein AMK31_18235 [Streptomyces sp. TSRI0107]
MRSTLGTLAAVVVTVPFLTAWKVDVERRAVSAQVPAPATPADARPQRHEAAHASAPIVLAYHDIQPEPTNDYTLTPKQLDDQLAALTKAGYRSLTTDEFIRYLATGRTPSPRSVYLTFDDGTRGLWTYADQILAKHKMTGSAYLITSRVGKHRPYYLSWAEIDRMAGSGRWDFQNHSHDGHTRAAVDSSGRKGAVLANRLWLAEEKRLESEKEYRTRVETDLDKSLRAFADHDLPKPRVFAYPYSEAGAPTNLAGQTTSVLEQLLHARFDTTLTNSSSRPLPAGPRAAAAGQVQRMEVMRATTTDALMKRIAEWTSRVPDEVPEPLRHPEQWRFPTSLSGTDVSALTGKGLEKGTYVQAAHLPMATADWHTYRVDATADRLKGPQTGVSIKVGHGSLHPSVVTVSASELRVTEQPVGAEQRVTVRKLTQTAKHRITVKVSPRSVQITVDGTSLTVRATDRPAPARTNGGFSLAVRNAGEDTPWPRFTSLRVSP